MTLTPPPSAASWEFFQQFAGGFGKYERGILYKMTQKAKTEAGTFPLYYTEWNTSAVLPDPIHDESYSAALIAKTIADNDGLVEGYSFWTFSDLFEELGQYSRPFHGGFGLLTIHEIPKPTYRVFELLHQMGGRRLKVEGDSAATVEMLATKDQGRAMFLIYNHNIPGAPMREEEVLLRLTGITSGEPAIMYRIDGESANPKKKWVELGSPEYPTREELEKIYQASVPMSSEIKPETVSGELFIPLKKSTHSGGKESSESGGNRPPKTERSDAGKINIPNGRIHVNGGERRS